MSISIFNLITIGSDFKLKTLVYSFVLSVTGLALLIAELVMEFAKEDKIKDIAIWILEGIAFIPVYYFSVLLWRAYRPKTASERMSISKRILDHK